MSWLALASWAAVALLVGGLTVAVFALVGGIDKIAAAEDDIMADEMDLDLPAHGSQDGDAPPRRHPDSIARRPRA